MDGIVNVFKPSGMTSFDVVRDIRKITKVKKVGHTGTLDPLASGVLPICIGKATKISDYIMEGTKSYRVELKLGITTDTYDREGKITSCNDVKVTEEQLISVLNNYIGDIEQVPPMYSAIKVKGKKLYELARKGIEVERESRKITIYNISVISIDMPYAIFDVKCSKGTYIRSLCYDIGKDLGCGGVMWNLQRIETSHFNIKQSISIDDLSEDNIGDYLIPIDKALDQYEAIYVDNRLSKPLLNGVTLKDRKLLQKLQEDKIYRTYIDNGNFVGLGSMNKYGFKIVKLLS
ncbi:tRNA pseudouridine(55) synthase TruB [Clostridium niameyense]|uniref:tRNA pseudouridine(55) synthase TruB n=1 Tax=Clostridium niameyense TaxID=1622073 RepID=UPI00067ED44D|nr:tRNA pseudouridine(55) synthase TruB [Clostridium niameyense]